MEPPPRQCRAFWAPGICAEKCRIVHCQVRPELELACVDLGRTTSRAGLVWASECVRAVEPINPMAGRSPKYLEARTRRVWHLCWCALPRGSPRLCAEVQVLVSKGPPLWGSVRQPRVASTRGRECVVRFAHVWFCRPGVQRDIQAHRGSHG